MIEQVYYTKHSLSSRKGKIMTEKETIKALEEQARNTKYLMDRLNKAAYGMTWEEYTRILCGKEENHEEHH